NDHLVELYPNPASKVLNVRVVGENNSEAMVLLTDLTGKLIYNSKLDGNTTENITQIDVSNYSSGVYMLSVSMGTVYSTYKVVIE
ncbi:MAG: T9SS type A sorting domain-containing protein, partial [Salibacteraceae bacterium]